MKWFVYETAPIDMFWEELPTVEATARKIGGSDAAELSLRGALESGSTLTIDSFLHNWDSAKTAALNHGWEGKFQGPAVVFWVPMADQFEYGFAFKQDTNGICYVISPCVLPHFADR